jgi:hypothetical protein
MEDDLKTGLYGYAAEFDNPTDLVAAAREANRAGYTRFEAYSPFPIEELAHYTVAQRTRLPAIIFAGGLIGALAGFGLQYFVHVWYYPLNVGGRPLNSWPNFVPVTFELTILLASAAAVFSMLALNGLPKPYQPVFNLPRFDLASQDRFFLVIEAGDPKFDADETKSFLNSLRAMEVSHVPY